MFKLDLEKAEEQIANICWSIKKAREFQKNVYFCFIDYAKAFVWITTNWKILKEMEIPDHLTRLLRKLYAVQEATVRTGHGTWKGVCQGCVLSPCLFNLHVEYIVWDARLDEAKRESRLLGEISITSDNADDTTLMAESEKELKSLLMKVKEESEKKLA